MGWLQDLIRGIGDAISGALSSTWNGISDSIWGKFMSFIYSMVYEALADFFTLMTEIGANLFDLGWVKAALHFFNLFGWGLFVAGLIVAIFDTAIEYQTMGRLNIKKQILPFLYIRELKALGIGVIFEKENINTLTETSEAMITIMGYFAQAESESISKNVTWGVRHAYAEGKVTFTCDIYGYHKVQDGIEIVEEEAAIVREIFERYYAGASVRIICDTLNERGVKAPGKKKGWYHATIQSILRNEKYKGDVITQKTFCSDLLTHKREKNNGQLPQHYITDHHEAIVDRELFDRVQSEYARRSAKKKIALSEHETAKKGKYSSKYALTEILVCGDCGRPYRRCTWTHHDKKKIVWRCTTRVDYGTSKCPDSPTLEEGLIHSAILKGLSGLIENKNEVKDELKAALGNVIVDAGTDICIQNLEAQIKEQENDMMKVVKICAERGSQKGFEDEFKRINDNISDLRKIIEVEKTKIRPSLDIDSRLERLFEQIANASADLSFFEDSIIRQLIAQIRVESQEKLSIILHNGFRFAVSI